MPKPGPNAESVVPTGDGYMSQEMTPPWGWWLMRYGQGSAQDSAHVPWKELCVT